MVTNLELDSDIFNYSFFPEYLDVSIEERSGIYKTENSSFKIHNQVSFNEGLQRFKEETFYQKNIEEILNFAPVPPEDFREAHNRFCIDFFKNRSLPIFLPENKKLLIGHYKNLIKDGMSLSYLMDAPHIGHVIIARDYIASLSEEDKELCCLLKMNGIIIRDFWWIQ